LNSREIISEYKKLKLTEKEVDIIIHLSKNKEPVSVNELQKKVWSYQSDIETHTVETHIYRLRKKIFNTFDNSNFIISKKNGYQVK
jgi:DNA-binding response OmpR family regulator